MRPGSLWLLPALVLLAAPAAFSASDRTATGFFYPTGSRADAGRGTPFLAGAPGHPPYAQGLIHTGCDIPGETRVTRVVAIADGEVVSSSMDLSYYGSSTGAPGGAVLARHETSAGTVYAVYGHVVPLAEKSALPPPGAPLTAGKAFALVGPYDLTPHLHFGIRRGCPDPEKPYRGFAPLADPPEAHGWEDPIAFITTYSPAEATGAGTDTVIVLDCSGSMARAGQDGVTKLAAAQRAARDALAVVRFDMDQLGHSHRVGVIGFSDGVMQRLEPTADLEAVLRAVAELRPTASTNFGDPLDLALSYLGRGGAEQRVILFLSDGMTNAGPVARDQFLVDRPEDFAHPLRLYQRARESGVTLHTVGFGDPAASGDDGCDEEVLRRLAEVPGTGGAYRRARDGFSLDRVYVQSIHEATGKLVLACTDEVSQGERQERTFPLTAASVQARRPGFSLFVTPAYAAAPDSQLLVTLGWDIGRLGMELWDPQGRLVDATYPGTHFQTDSAPLCVAVDAPMVGEWRVTVVGEEAPRGPVRYHLLASARLSHPTTVSAVGVAEDWQSFGLVAELAGIMVLTAGCIAVRRRQRGSTAWCLQVETPGRSRYLEGLRRGAVVLGRDPEAALSVPDSTVSWRHAELSCSRRGVLLRDLGSANGTRVNGEPVAQRWLREGDVVLLGHTRLTLLTQAPGRRGRAWARTGLREGRGVKP